MVVPQLVVVGVAMSYRPLVVHCSSEAMSSVLMLKIASYNVGFGLLVGVECSSGWATGVVARSSVCCPAGSEVGC